MSHPNYGTNDRVKEVKNDVDEAKEIMSRNLDQMMSNLESAHDLERKTDELSTSSVTFRQRSKQVKWQMIRNNLKSIGFVIVILIFILLIIILVAMSNRHH